MDLRE
jgi:hypothetical protein